MSTIYYKIPDSDLLLFFLQEGKETIEPTLLYDGSWVISSKALELKFIPASTLEKVAKYDYWTEIDPLWFRSTYDAVQELEVTEELSEEEVESIKDSIKPVKPPNKREEAVKEEGGVINGLLDSIKSAWNSLFS